MKLETVNSCINCENLMRDFICKKHNQTVAMNNVCESHSFGTTFNKNSSCSNCYHFGMESCSKPKEASDSMFCFDWMIK
tara:strand:- start:2450 stop:2686 length:237 start_codon:yes stop_codon:yes gene_type:complete